MDLKGTMALFTNSPAKSPRGRSTSICRSRPAVAGCVRSFSLCPGECPRRAGDDRRQLVVPQPGGLQRHEPRDRRGQLDRARPGRRTGAAVDRRQRAAGRRASRGLAAGHAASLGPAPAAGNHRPHGQCPLPRPARPAGRHGLRRTAERNVFARARSIPVPPGERARRLHV